VEEGRITGPKANFRTCPRSPERRQPPAVHVPATPPALPSFRGDPSARLDAYLVSRVQRSRRSGRRRRSCTSPTLLGRLEEQLERPTRGPSRPPRDRGASSRRKSSADPSKEPPASPCCRGGGAKTVALVRPVSPRFSIAGGEGSATAGGEKGGGGSGRALVRRGHPGGRITPGGERLRRAEGVRHPAAPSRSRSRSHPPEPELGRHVALVMDPDRPLRTRRGRDPDPARGISRTNRIESGGEHALREIPKFPLFDSRKIPVADPELGGNLADRLPSTPGALSRRNRRAPTFIASRTRGASRNRPPVFSLPGRSKPRGPSRTAFQRVGRPREPQPGAPQFHPTRA